MLVDSHCHLNCLDISVDEALKNAKANGLGAFLNVSINMETFPEVISIAEQNSNVFASVGLHPNEQGREPTQEELVTTATNPKIVAIGETGLDYFRSEGDLTWQQNRFRTHIKAAIAANLPLIIHTRDAEQDTLRIMREEDASKAGGVMHCFTGSAEMARACVEMGFFISFSGIVTFKNAKSLQELAMSLPIENILVETDSPYLAPMPHRGKTNQPAYTLHVAEKIAELKGLSLEEVTEITTKNFARCFSKTGL